MSDSKEHKVNCPQCGIPFIAIRSPKDERQYGQFNAECPECRCVVTIFPPIPLNVDRIRKEYEATKIQHYKKQGGVCSVCGQQYGIDEMSYEPLGGLSRTTGIYPAFICEKCDSRK